MLWVRIMIPYTIGLMNELFMLYSLSAVPDSVEEFIAGNNTANTVFLTPGTDADFSVRAYNRSACLFKEHYAAALVAAAFLVSKRGLPLSEITFETPSGNIDIFNTGGGVYVAVIKKRKQSCTKSTDILGCGVESTDVFFDFCVRCAHVGSLDNVDEEAFSLYLSVGNSVPADVVIYELSEDLLKIKRVPKYLKHPISNITAFAAASCSAFCRGESPVQKRLKSICDGVNCEVGLSAARIFWKADKFK